MLVALELRNTGVLLFEVSISWLMANLLAEVDPEECFLSYLFDCKVLLFLDSDLFLSLDCDLFILSLVVSLC